MRTHLAFLTLLLVVPASALADSMRCGTHIVDEGLESGEVRALCGEPRSIQRFRDTRILAGEPSVFTEVQVELWVYDLGPHSFIQKLRFEDGELVQIRSGGYGTSDP